MAIRPWKMAGLLAALVAVALAGAASAVIDNWMVVTKTDTGTGLSLSLGGQHGGYSAAADGHGTASVFLLKSARDLSSIAGPPRRE